MGGKIVFIKTAYWIGIIGDLLSCIPLLFPDIAKRMYGLEDILVSGEYLYVARIAASLMLGWTFLLIWAVFRPLERKGVLLLTIIPVMCGLIIADVLAVSTGPVMFSYMVPVFVFSGIIVIIYSLAYYFASQLARDSI